MGVFAVSAVLYSCSDHEIPYYEGADTLYFDQQWGVAHFDSLQQQHQNYSDVCFGIITENDSVLRIKVACTGYARDYDRPFTIEVVADSTTAVGGVHYTDLASEHVIPAGKLCTYVPVKCLRTPDMEGKCFQLQLRVVPNEYFEPAQFGEEGVGLIPLRNKYQDIYDRYSTNADPAIHNVFINGNLRQPPATCWNNLQFGSYFSETKFRLLIKIAEKDFGWSVVDFFDTKMSVGRSPLVAKHVAAYLMEQYSKGREHWVLDEDGSMMYVNGVRWIEGQDPNEYN